MKNASLKGILAAAAIALSGLAPAHAGEATMSRNTGIGHVIAAQGNLALHAIRADLKAALRLVQPVLPKHSTKVSVPTAGAAGSLAATTRCAK